MAADAAGNVYIADTFDNVVRKVIGERRDHHHRRLRHPGFGGDGGPATSAKLNHPRGVAVDALGNVYVADTANNRVRKIDPVGTISTVAGNGTVDFVVPDGAATQQGLSDPRGVAVDQAGNVYVAETGHNRVRKISPAGAITTIAGNGTCCYTGDGGLGTAAQLNQPWGLAVDAEGNVYVADSGNNAIRVLTPASANIQVGAVVNAASNLPGPVAPGELVVLYGTGLAGVQTVLFNGTAGPLLYTTLRPGRCGGPLRGVRRNRAGGGAIRGCVVRSGSGIGRADRARRVHRRWLRPRTGSGGRIKAALRMEPQPPHQPAA